MPEEPNKKEYDNYREAVEEEFGRVPKEEMPPAEIKEERPSPEKPKEVPIEEIPEEAAVPSPPPISEEAERESKKIKNLPQDRQLQALVDLAFKKGLRHSIDTARALKNPYILDKFHDTIVDHLYKELVERGKLKEL